MTVETGTATSPSRAGIRTRLNPHHIVLATILVAGLILRVWVMARAGWMIDGDEATFGLMARHILQGERPIFLYGQPYMGSFQAYEGAVSFALFGMSRAALKAITLPEFVAFALSIYLLAQRIAGARVALVATLLTAIPPVYVAAATVRVWGPLLDTMTLGNLILLLAIDDAYGDSPPRLPWLRFFAIGVMAGLGFWFHGQILIYLITAAIILFLRDKRVVFQPRLVAAAAGFAIGAAPVLWFSLTHDYTTFHYMLGIGAQRTDHSYVEIAWFYLRRNLPLVLGLAVPWAPSPWWLKAPVALILAGLLLPVVVRRYRGVLGWLRLSLRQGSPEDALLLFAGLMSLAFVFSSFGDLALRYQHFDATGRYAIPLVSVIPILLGIAVVGLARRSQIVAGVILAVLVVYAIGGYVRSEPADVWQSPYWRHLPASNTDLIAALDGMGVDAVWMNHWAGKPLMFDTEERIAAADYYDLAVGGGIDRLPRATERVRAAALPAYVFTTDQAHLPIEDWLAERRIEYEKRVVPGYVVIRPLQPVQPADVVQFLGFDT